MEQSIDTDLTIKSITAVPRSKNFYNFYINSTPEKRSMKPEKLADLITERCPAVGGTARIMIYELRAFYVEIETNTIKELGESQAEPESKKELIFGTRKTVIKQANKPKEPEIVDRRKDMIFKNILKLMK